MCKADDCCCCFTLRSGAIAAFVASFICCIFTLIWGCNEIVDSKAGIELEMPLFIGGVLLLVVTALMAFGTISLLISILKDKAWMSKVWLIVALMYIFLTVLAAFAFIFRDENPIWEFGIAAIAVDVILLYLWFEVLNFYWFLNRGVEAEISVHN